MEHNAHRSQEFCISKTQKRWKHKKIYILTLVHPVGKKNQTKKHSLVKSGPSSLIGFGGQEARVAAVAHQSHVLAHGRHTAQPPSGVES